MPDFGGKRRSDENSIENTTLFEIPLDSGNLIHSG